MTTKGKAIKSTVLSSTSSTHKKSFSPAAPKISPGSRNTGLIKHLRSVDPSSMSGTQMGNLVQALVTPPKAAPNAEMASQTQPRVSKAPNPKKS